MSNDAPTPLVSIIVPAFNAERTVADSVRSATQGRYQNIEIIFVDDGSTDRTGEIADDLATADARIQVHRQSNKGLSAALNAGFELARGNYLARLDADDLWHPDKLARQMALFEGEPELALVACWVRYVDTEGRVTNDGPAQRFPRQALCRGYVESLVGGGSTVVMTRAAVVEAGGCDEGLRGWEDLLLQLAISARHLVAIVPAFLAGYRVSSAGMTADSAAMLSGWRAVRSLIADRFPQIPGWVHRWAHARRIMMFAEAFAWRGAYARSASLIGEAKLTDPAWAIRFLAFRLTRRLRGSGSAPQEFSGPDFFDCDPDRPTIPPPITSGGLARLEQERNRRIKQIDRRLYGESAAP